MKNNEADPFSPLWIHNWLPRSPPKREGMPEENSIEAVEKVLGKPVAAEFTENAMKVRRNLLVASLISIFAIIGGIKLDPNSTILGFKFLGITEHLIRVALIVTTTYLLAHFLWYVFDGFYEWRIRVTGTRLAFKTGMMWASEHADYPDDPRQSTL